MEEKKTCDICKRVYKLTPTNNKEPFMFDTSHVKIDLKEPGRKSMFDYDVCPECAKRLVYYIIRLRRDAPRKCFWCEFDLGPKSPNYPHPNCAECSQYNKFKLKKRLTPHALAEWKWFNGEV